MRICFVDPAIPVSFAAMSAATLSRMSCCASAVHVPERPAERGSGGSDMRWRSPAFICARTGAIGVSFSAAMPVKNFKIGTQINSAITIVSPR